MTSSIEELNPGLKDLGTYEYDWTDIARAVRDHGMECTMTTGGRGLTPERVKAAKEAGIRSVSVSVDGLESTHDALRGVKGSWRAATASVRTVIPSFMGREGPGSGGSTGHPSISGLPWPSASRSPCTRMAPSASRTTVGASPSACTPKKA